MYVGCLRGGWWEIRKRLARFFYTKKTELKLKPDRGQRTSRCPKKKTRNYLTSGLTSYTTALRKSRILTKFSFGRSQMPGTAPNMKQVHRAEVCQSSSSSLRRMFRTQEQRTGRELIPRKRRCALLIEYNFAHDATREKNTYTSGYANFLFSRSDAHLPATCTNRAQEVMHRRPCYTKS